LNEIAPLTSKGPKGEALFLGYKTSRSSFFLPYRLVDDGYVVGIKGSNSYFKLDPAKIKSLQATGELPTPLPAYEIDPVEYAFGHSLWALPALFGVIFWFMNRAEKTRKVAMPHFDSARVHHEANNLDAAVADYSKAIEIDPKFADAYVNRAIAFRNKGEPQNAIADYSKVIKMDSKSALALFSRGTTFQQIGQLDAAISDFSRVMKLDKSGLADFARAEAYAAKGDHTRAIKDYSSAIKKAPDVSAVYEGRAKAYTATGKLDLARADEQKIAHLQAQTAAPA
jgi:tetratricopeptide (TPR) repeat protein